VVNKLRDADHAWNENYCADSFSVLSALVASSRGRSPIYLPNLNGIRFIAAAMVFLDHVEWTKQMGGQPSYNSSAFMSNNGALGVSLFFVLSGFLITYLLIVEKGRAGVISVRDFYVRRMLRIWPLYFLTVLLAFFILPWFISIPGWDVSFTGPNFWVRLLLFVGMVPNLAYVCYPLVPFAAQLWTVGVEEQFYLVWPFVCRSSTRRLPVVMLAILLAAVTARTLCYQANAHWGGPFWQAAANFAWCFRVQCMAIGGLAAWLVHYGNARVLGVLFDRRLQVAMLVLAVGVHLFSANFFGSLQIEVMSVIFALIILDAAANPATLVRLEYGPLPYLGRISYGIYVYQILAIRVSFLVIDRWVGFANPVHRFGSMYVVSALLTVGLAAVSYHFLERPFLRLKAGFSVVPSAP